MITDSEARVYSGSTLKGLNILSKCFDAYVLSSQEYFEHMYTVPK